MTIALPWVGSTPNRLAAAVARAVVGVSLLVASAASGQADPLDQDAATPARPSLISEFDGLVPGRVNTLAVTFELHEGWHVYWHGQNDTGFPVGVEVTLPPGVQAGEVLRPAGKRYISKGGILDYVYEGEEATLLIPVAVPASFGPGRTVSVKVDLEWLVCREACIPGWATLERELRVLDPSAFSADGPPLGKGAERIAEARRRLPVPLPPDATDVKVRWEGGVLLIEAERPVKKIAFLPHEDGRRVLDALKTGESETGRLRLRIDEGDEPVRGVVVLTIGDGARPLLYRIETEPPGEGG